MQIRSCRPDECDRVLELWKQAGARPTHTDDLAELERVARDHGDLFLVAEEGSAIVGSLIAGWDGWRAHLYRVAVSPDQRRKGVAKALVEEALERLRKKGARRLSVLAVTDDQHSIDFWDALSDLGLTRDPWPKTRYIGDF